MAGVEGEAIENSVAVGKGIFDGQDAYALTSCRLEGGIERKYMVLLEA